MGFVVAKFGIFLLYIAPPGTTPAHKTGASLVIGLLMVGLGTAICLGAALQFRGFVKLLSRQELPPRWSPSFALWIAYALALGGLGLVVYLAI